MTALRAQQVPDEIGYRLAGLADGEGCFYISSRLRAGNRYCQFTIKLREDDRAVLERFRDGCFGIGKLVVQPRPDRCPTIRWDVYRKAEVVFVRDLFDRFPLWSKKRRDFAIWSEAVDFWAHAVGWGTDWAPMAEIKERLAAVRVYSPVPVGAPE